MNVDTLSDPAQLAQAIRGLARDAHHTLTHHSPSATALRGLSRRIERLGSALGDRRGGPLGSWLDSLGREVQSAAGRRVWSSGPACLAAAQGRTGRRPLAATARNAWGCHVEAEKGRRDAEDDSRHRRTSIPQSPGGKPVRHAL
jgi:hypothetical protein